MELEKLEYLSFFLKTRKESNSEGKQIKPQSNKLNWTYLKKDIICLINNEVESNINSKNKNKENLTIELKNKKLKILCAYFNLVIFTIALRYAEIVIKVKHGGLIFCSFSLLTFYYGNKYFNKLQAAEMLKELSFIYKKEPEEYLNMLKYKNKKNTKEEKLTQIKLSKYWKEPMSWH